MTTCHDCHGGCRSLDGIGLGLKVTPSPSCAAPTQAPAHTGVPSHNPALPKNFGAQRSAAKPTLNKNRAGRNEVVAAP